MHSCYCPHVGSHRNAAESIKKVGSQGLSLIVRLVRRSFRAMPDETPQLIANLWAMLIYSACPACGANAKNLADAIRTRRRSIVRGAVKGSG